MSEYEKLQNLLDKELAKLRPDADVIYALKVRIPYANTIDTERVNRGSAKISELLGEKQL